MAEFGVIEQQQMMSGLTDQQKLLFQSQFASERKDRTTILVLSVLLGGLGIDRFMIGETGMGLLKLLTGGVCGILWLIDIFTITGKVDEYNRTKANEIVAGLRLAAK
jgi:TM2 domain-containing membrane protein YozV